MYKAGLFAWESAQPFYILIFLSVLVVLIGGFFFASSFMTWQSRRRIEKEIRQIERQSGLTDEEADYVVYISNKNKLNQPTTLYQSLRVFDTLVGRDIEMLMDSAAPFQEKNSVVGLAYSARSKLFPHKTQILSISSSEGLDRKEEEA